MGTKFQHENAFDQENNFKRNVDYGSNIVRGLACKFDSIEKKNIGCTRTNLKQISKEQAKLISNLKDQVVSKEKRIQELENKIKLLMSPNEIKISMNESSA